MEYFVLQKRMNSCRNAWLGTKSNKLESVKFERYYT
ncbi:hypothetical protein VPHD249_0103 [Vibrio phage D249]